MKWKNKKWKNIVNILEFKISFLNTFQFVKNRIDLSKSFPPWKRYQNDTFTSAIETLKLTIPAFVSIVYEESSLFSTFSLT